MNQNSLIEQLESLQVEHEVLDREITKLTAGGMYEDIRISRLKKRKLVLKDQMGRLRDALVPDIIA
ncbi:MAG: DUF465 domain-containing protein [Alphaproteobacteria bacterium]|jgi:hypothetical protein|nr:DUF465 domain-containing protein [Alphaproteobacteria bacterium]HJM61223.1 DUF465 domain-containing protein [Alphaproteobacteria bacterium]